MARLLRIPQLEEDLWALGSVTFANMFEDQPEDVRAGLIRAHTLVSFGKRFDNLALQELRLARHQNNLLKQLGGLLQQCQTEELDARAAGRRAASQQKWVRIFRFAEDPSGRVTRLAVTCRKGQGPRTSQPTLRQTDRQPPELGPNHLKRPASITVWKNKRSIP